MKHTSETSESEPARIILYTDDTMLGLGAQGVLSGLPLFEVFLAEPCLAGLLPLVEKVDPDIILLDLSSDMTLGLVSALRQSVPHARLILWARSFSEELRHQANEMGVAGFLLRNISQEQFIQGVTSITSGSALPAILEPAHSKTVALTRRESQLVSLLVQGMRNKEIAACIGITEGTVRIYLSKLFVKIGARDRFEVAVFGMKNAYCGQASWDGQNAFVTEADEERARPVLRSLVLVEPQRRRGYAEQRKASVA